MFQDSFSTKKVFVTGGSRGIGRATAIAFAQAGAQVAFSYHSNLDAAANTLSQMPGNGHLSYQLDLGNVQMVKDTLEAAIKDLGGIDILVNNAGIFTPHPIDQLDFAKWMELWQRTMDVNLNGVAAACHTAVQVMIKTGGGRIINVGSRGAFRGEGNQPGYGASKAGLHALSQSLAQALGKHKIMVHAVAPGFVETAMARPHLQGEAGEAVKAQSPLNRVATVEDVSNAILFLASEEATFTTGCVLDINGASYLH